MSRASEARTAIKALIAQGIDQAIKRLEEILDPASPAFNTFIQLKSRYSLYLTNVVLGMTSPDELNRQYAQISHAFIIVTDALQDTDLRPEASAVPAAVPRRGELLYHIPRQMQENREYRCAVRVAYLKELLYGDWETHEGDIQKNIRVAEVMSVELVSLDENEPFNIRALHSTVQFLDENDFTEWVFLVKPRQSGEFNLALRVSVIEIRDGREVKKDVVLEQYVIVATEAPEAVPQFANSGVQLNFMEEMPPQAASLRQERSADINTASRKTNSGVRTTALFLAFLMAGTTATWAFTPPPTRDWWKTRYWEDSPAAYAEYIEKYKDSDTKQHLEKARFYKADRGNALSDLREYQRQYPQGQFRAEVLEKIQTLEIKAVASIRQQPDAENIRRFVIDFPESERLPDVAQAAASRPEVLQAVQPELENAFLQKMEQNPTEWQVELFLQYFPLPAQQDRLERILEKNPALRKQVSQKIETAQKNRLQDRRRQANDESLDTDADGIPDQNDRCPGVAGDAANNGCPTSLRGQKDRSRSGLDMVRVPGGTFIMGCRENRDKECMAKEKPDHEVTLSGFEIGKYEVTQADWRAIMGGGPPQPHNQGCDECPVESVSWNDVQTFLQKLNDQTGRNYRLPTEAEWEFAARGGNRSQGFPYPGGYNLEKVAWYSRNSESGNAFGSQKTTRPAGTKERNELGLFDMGGNVSEWCSDFWGNYPAEKQTNPAGPNSGSQHVVRGGSWSTNVTLCRTASRRAEAQNLRNNGVGFRLARTN